MFQAWVRLSSWLKAACLAAGAMAWSACVQAAEVRVAVAANFAAPMQKIAAAFERDTGHRILISLGSTGRLYAQIKNGAPFDVFLAADTDTPARLEREGQAVPGSRITYATGRLVLWSRQAGLVDAQGQVLRKSGAAHMALADPKLAPYGRAAVQTLMALGLIDAWRPRFVLGESIAQAHQFVASGNAPLGMVAYSQVFQDGRLTEGSAWLVPAHLHDPIRQDAVLLMRGHKQPAAVALLKYLQSDATRSIVRLHGYEN